MLADEQATRDREQEMQQRQQRMMEDHYNRNKNLIPNESGAFYE